MSKKCNYTNDVVNSKSTKMIKNFLGTEERGIT